MDNAHPAVRAMSVDWRSAGVTARPVPSVFLSPINSRALLAIPFARCGFQRHPYRRIFCCWRRSEYGGRGRENLVIPHTRQQRFLHWLHRIVNERTDKPVQFLLEGPEPVQFIPHRLRLWGRVRVFRQLVAQLFNTAAASVSILKTPPGLLARIPAAR